MFNAHKCGLFSGAFFALVHALWSLLVAVGVAQAYMDFIFRLHMLEPFMVVLPFSIGSAALLVVLTGIIGYIVGYVSCQMWNAMVKMK